MTTQRIIIAGGSGFLGQLLGTFFAERGTEVVVLSRSPRSPDDRRIRNVFWDAQTLGDWQAELANAHAVINLAGRTVNCRYDAHNRREILESRVDSTRILGEAIARSTTPPKVWLNASTATIYQHTFGPAWDESGRIAGTAEVNDEFSVEVTQAWERALDDAATPHTRKIALRAAMVLGHAQNSVFPTLRRLTRCGLGGRMGDGRQFVSWIHQLDFCRAIEFLIERDDLSGPINLAAPTPLKNAEMMAAFRRLCGIRIGLPATRWMLELGAFFLRTETELILKSRRVIPGRLLTAGYQFQFAQFGDAVRELLVKQPS